MLVNCYAIGARRGTVVTVDSPAFRARHGGDPSTPPKGAKRRRSRPSQMAIPGGQVSPTPIAADGALREPIAAESVQSGRLRSPGVYIRGFCSSELTARPCQGQPQSSPSGSSDTGPRTIARRSGHTPQSTPAPSMHADPITPADEPTPRLGAVAP